MEEIKMSENGIKYIPTMLKEGPQVYSQAILQRIPHHDLNKVDISLKIGRYRQPFRELETQKPKSELTLTNDELNALIEYLSTYYKPIEMNADKFITVKVSSAELIKKFKELIDNQEEAARLLLDNEILTDNVFVSVSAIKKQQAIAEFERMLAEDLPESRWQHWFESNKWILGSDFAQIINERDIDTENIADYIMKAFDGFIDLVEIKKPNGLNFWAANKDHDNFVPSTDLIKAITQCLNYIYEIEREANSQKFIERTKSKVVKPRCILIFGRSGEWSAEQREAYRILNASYNQITILTYDHLLSRAKNIFAEQEYEKNVEEDLPF